MIELKEGYYWVEQQGCKPDIYYYSDDKHWHFGERSLRELPADHTVLGRVLESKKSTGSMNFEEFKKELTTLIDKYEEDNKLTIDELNVETIVETSPIKPNKFRTINLKIS